MAVTQNTYTGDGTTVLFSFTFPYLETTDIKVSVNGTNTTAYTLANATTIQFNTAPVNGAAIRIYRETDDSALAAAFYPGSAIRSADLNDNFTQNLYVTQESNNNATTAITTANTALTNSTTAISTANSALSQSTTALSNSSTALSQSNTAISDSATALSQSNTAISDSAAAVSTANTASTNASAAVSTANTASTNASAAVSTANTASSNASAAVSTANTASSNATTAVNTANNALSAANAAQSTANTADANANAALNAIAGTVQYVLVANVAAIPSTPGNGDAIEIADSTGIESFTPITNLPAGFVGDSGLSVRLQYLSAGSSWNWLNYFANNSETRYLKFGGGTITGNLEIGNSGSLTFEGSTANAFETTLAVTDPTADRTITLPDVSGTVVTTGDTGSVTSTMIADGTIVDADVNASAAIAGTKISPDFGSQIVSTTGSSTAAGFIPSSSTIPTNGLYLPAANSVGISTNSTGRLFVDASGNVGVGVSAPDTLFTCLTSDNTIAARFKGANGIFRILPFETGLGVKVTALNGNESAFEHLAIQGASHSFVTGVTERMRLDSSGRLGIGTSAPNQALEVVGSQWLRGAYSTNTALAFVGNSGVGRDFAITRSAAATMSLEMSGRNAFNIVGNTGNTDCFFTFSGTGTTEHMRLDSSGRLGIGTTNPSGLLHLSSVSPNLILQGSAYPSVKFRNSAGTDIGEIYYGVSGLDLNITNYSAGPIGFIANGSERARIDSSGRLLVGTSSSRTGGLLQVESVSSTIERIHQFTNNSASAAGPILVFYKTRGTAVGSNTLVSNNDDLGAIVFSGADGTNRIDGALIQAFVDGTPGTNDMPGRLVFSTCPDGSASPVERWRIDSSGSLVGVAGSAFVAPYVYNTTTATAANVNVDATGFLRRSTSSIKYKINVETIQDQYADAILGCRPVWYQSTCEADKPEWGYWGFIAEEVAAIDPRLCFFKEEEDGTLEPEGVQYDRFVPHLLNLIQRQQQAIKTLEAKVAALESA